MHDCARDTLFEVATDLTGIPGASVPTISLSRTFQELTA